jgi:transmembrane sensor
VVLTRPQVYWRRARVPLAMFAVVAVIVLLYTQWPRPADRVATYETGFGENREFLMPDGSTMTLGAKTTLTAYYSDRRRMVVLNSGEGLFEVAHDPKRPFIVIAGPGAITALGTSFNVLRDSDRVVVTVINGTVDVAPHEPSMEDRGTSGIGPSASARSKSTHLSQGQEIAYGEHGAASPITSVDSNMATAWRDGRLEYHEESLRHVIMDVNRYQRRPIICDPEVGELLYTGDVRQDNIDAWVGKLHKVYPVEVVDTDPTHVLIRLDPEAAGHESR